MTSSPRLLDRLPARVSARLPDAASATSGAGAAVAGAIGLLARVRRVDKPMHPRGEVLLARLHRVGGATTGAAFIDEPGDDEVLVRFSRSIGLPAPWPDVNGLALRVPAPGAPGGHADLLMSGTGSGRWLRYVLAPSLRERGFVGTLLRYGTPTGPVHLAARPLDDVTWELAFARPGAGWTAFGRLELGSMPARDLDLSFDATAGGPDGLTVPEWHRRLRGPAYAAARRVRRRRHQR